MRRLATFAIVAGATATGTLWWLHDGDLEAAIEPVLDEWNADELAREAGVSASDDVEVAVDPGAGDTPGQ